VKKLTLFLLLAACGDNIHPDEPDAYFDFSDVMPEILPPKGTDGPACPEPGAPGHDVCRGIDAGVPDAVGSPDAAVCEDSHVELNGHEHRCQHDQELP
jgi:hypothetical protein